MAKEYKQNYSSCHVKNETGACINPLDCHLLSVESQKRLPKVTKADNPPKPKSNGVVIPGWRLKR